MPTFILVVIFEGKCYHKSLSGPSKSVHFNLKTTGYYTVDINVQFMYPSLDYKQSVRWMDTWSQDEQYRSVNLLCKLRSIRKSWFPYDSLALLGFSRFTCSICIRSLSEQAHGHFSLLESECKPMRRIAATPLCQCGSGLFPRNAKRSYGKQELESFYFESFS